MEEEEDKEPTRVQAIQVLMLWIGNAKLRDSFTQVS